MSGCGWLADAEFGLHCLGQKRGIQSACGCVFNQRGAPQGCAPRPQLRFSCRSCCSSSCWVRARGVPLPPTACRRRQQGLEAGSAMQPAQLVLRPVDQPHASLLGDPLLGPSPQRQMARQGVEQQQAWRCQGIDQKAKLQCSNRVLGLVLQERRQSRGSAEGSCRVAGAHW